METPTTEIPSMVDVETLCIAIGSAAVAFTVVGFVLSTSSIVFTLQSSNLVQLVRLKAASSQAFYIGFSLDILMPIVSNRPNLSPKLHQAIFPETRLLTIRENCGGIVLGAAPF
jgi:hypothetical protein